MIKFNMAPTARRLVEQVLAVRPGERVLVVTDTDRPASITRALAHAVAAAGGKLAVLCMPPHRVNGVDPLPHVGAAMQASDAVYLQTTCDLDHTDTVRECLRKGVRLVTMWGFEEEMMVIGGAMADYGEVARTTERIAEVFRNARTGRFTTPEGSDVTFSVEGRRITALVGAARERGSFAAFPDGEAAVSPVEGSAKGVMVNPFSIEYKDLGFVTEPIRIEIRDGRVASAAGSAAADRLWGLLEEHGELAKNVAEFAVGTNPACRKRATMREAKKVWGTCHVAVGDSVSLGGRVRAPIHVDMIFDNPTVWADDHLVVRDGKIVL